MWSLRCMFLCYGFVMKTVVITHQCVSYCLVVLSQRQDIFCFSHCSASKQVRRAQDIGGEGTAGTAYPNWPRDIPYSTTSCSAIIPGRRRRKGEVSSALLTVMCDITRVSWRWLPMGSGEWIPCFTFLLCAVLFYVLNCLYLNLKVFLL